MSVTLKVVQITILNIIKLIFDKLKYFDISIFFLNWLKLSLSTDHTLR